MQQRDGEGVLSPVPYPQALLPSLIKNDSEEESEQRGLIFTWERQRVTSSKTFLATDSSSSLSLQPQQAASVY